MKMSETSQPSSENEKSKSKRPRGPRKRQVHNEVERRRKDKINGWISKIAELLPSKELHKQSKISILEQTVDYIKLLAAERDKLLSENRSEVQEEEVKKLKRDLKVIQEQNAVYEKLLQQANISVNSLPKKVLKYSGKFEKKNGILSVKNTESNTCTRIDSAIQVSSDLILNIPNTNCTVSNDTLKPSETPVSKVAKTSAKSMQNGTKVQKIAPISTVCSAVKSCVPTSDINNRVSSCAVIPPLITQTVYQGNPITQENIVPIVNCNETLRNSASLHAGGVTTVLSQFPVMSTTHDSSFSNVCNKNVPTIIIPTGGSILQHFSAAEKPSNTISIICPSTLPILVPQQVINVSSMARNVGLPSTVLCPAPVNSHCSPVDKSALLSLTPSSVVPISSSIAANTRIILPSQATVLNNICDNTLTPNAISALVNPVPQVPGDALIVPFVQKPSVVSSVNPPVKANCSVSNASHIANLDFQSKTESSSTPLIESEKENSSLSPSKDLEISKEKEMLSSTTLPSNSSSEIPSSSKCTTESKKALMNRVINLSSNSPPSLQVLSANKIISLANQSQKVRTSLVFPLYQKSTSKATSVSLQRNNDKSDHSPNNICLQIDTPGVSSNVASNEKEPLNYNAMKTTTPGTKFSDETPKSNFSLTVLMADGNDKINSNISQNSHESKSTHEMPILQTCISSSNIASTTTTSIPFPSIPVSEAILDFVKRNNNVFDSASQNNASSKDFNSNSVIEESSTSKPNNEKSIGNNEPKFLDLNNVSVSLNVSSTSNAITNTQCSIANTSASKNTGTSPCSSSDCSKLIQGSSLCYSDNSTSLKCINPLQNVMPQSNQSSNLNASAHIDTVNPAFHDNGTYVMNDSTLNQNILPSLFSNSQIVTLNTPIFVCSSGQENTESVLLSQNLHVTNEIATTVNSYILSNPVSSFSTLNKDSVLPNTFSTVSTCADTAKSSGGSDTDAAVSASTNTPVENLRSKSNVLNIVRSNKSLNSSDSECSKPVSKKKGKSIAKVNRSNVSDAKNVNCESISEINPNFDINKSQSVEKSSSFAKDASGCMRQESTNFLFTSDILARATESIFGNDVLETNHIAKRDAMCFSEESSNVNNSSAVSSKLDESSFKVQSDEVRDHMIIESTSSVASDNTKKSDAVNDMHNITISTCVENVQTNNENIHDMNQKQNRSCRIRKPKTSAENEPPSKKLKETSDVPNKLTGAHSFNNSKQSENSIEKQSDTVGQANISCSEKQASSESSSPGVDQSGIDSIGNFNNQIHLSENNCKTPSSVDAIFSLTPMLGDILKDVSHGINVESRNSGFLPCNDNQTLFPSDKNFISFNYVNNANEEYLSLPRMYFPIIPEITAAPVVPATNVSFAHSVSLCSTQSVSLKTTETLSSSESPGKSDPKKKNTSSDIHNSLPNSLSQELSSTNAMAKQSDCILKFSESEPQFSIGSSKVSNNGSLLFDTQSTDVHATNINVTHSNLIIPQSEANFNARDNFMPIVSHGVTFYPSLSSSSSIQNFVSSSSPAVSHSNYHCNNANTMVSMPYSVQASSSGSNTSSFTSQSAMSKADSLSHSLCSLLKETTNILAENRTGSTGAVSSQSINSSSSANISQSKYSALSLIADQTFSEPVSSSACHTDYGQNSMTCTTSSSEMQFAASSSCSRNQRSSLSYSAESLIQTSCANSEKNKNKNAANSRYQHRSTEKKNDRNSMTSLHNITDTNIFMPVSNCDIIQNAPLVPLPPVTSFHNFPSSYTMCESVPSTTIFNSVSRSHDIALSLSNDNFLNHMNLTVESQMLNNRHDMSSAVPKHSNSITLPFENHGSLYNNCNFLPPVKPTLENSRASESNACFQPASFNNSYPQQSQKPNCCHFSHRTIATNPELTGDMNLPVVPPVASFHTEKNNFQANRSSLQTTFTQSNANYVGNFFYNPAANARDINDMTMKPSNLRASQETFVPEGVRQNIHDHNAGIIFNNRKSVSSSRSKSKKVKNNSINESNMNVIPNSMVNFCGTQEVSCSKANISCVPNGYFKNNTHSVIPPPSQLSCSQNKISESATNTVIPANPSFNSVLHQQGDTFLNLNFQPSNFTMSPLPRPPTQPLSCSCITTPIISHTFSSTAHPVPNFNLSNILPDMGCSANQVSLSPVKFPPMNHALPSSSAQCQANPTITNSAHIVSHQSCAPALYPPHPPMVRNTLNPILSHNPQSLSDSQVSLVGGSGTSMIPQNTTFSATQNPTFRNVIHSLAFPRSDR